MNLNTFLNGFYIGALVLSFMQFTITKDINNIYFGALCGFLFGFNVAIDWFANQEKAE